MLSQENCRSDGVNRTRNAVTSHKSQTILHHMLSMLNVRRHSTSTLKTLTLVAAAEETHDSNYSQWSLAVVAVSGTVLVIKQRICVSVSTERCGESSKWSLLPTR
jgi:hypothetical protein